MSEMTTVKILLPTPELEKIKALAAVRGSTVTQALREAIATECFFASQPPGTHVLLERHGKAREVVFGELRP